MSKMWLPISYGGRTRNILIPNVQDIDDSQLNEIVAWQKEKTLDELKKLPPKQPHDVMKAKEVGAALKDYTNYLKRVKSGDSKKYY